MQLARVGKPVIGVERAQAGLFVDRGQRFFGRPGQHIGLDHTGAGAGALQARAREVNGGRRVVQGQHREAARSQRSDLIARTATGHGHGAERRHELR